MRTRGSKAGRLPGLLALSAQTRFLSSSVVAAVALLIGACSGGGIRSVCVEDTDCGEGLCVQGRCEKTRAQPTPPPDAGQSVYECAEPCGNVCCPDASICMHGACVPRCDTMWCGDVGQEICCAEGEVCGDDKRCITPPPPPPDCGTQVWDETLQACAARVRLRHCERPAAEFEPEVLWRVTPADGFDQVVATPIVIDVNGDGISDVVAPFYNGALGHDGPAVLRALSGLDGRELWSVPATEGGARGVSQPAAAVLDFWEPVTVLVPGTDGLLRAYDGATGELRWLSRDLNGQGVLCDVGWGAPAVADLNGDSRPEIVCGFTVFDRTGVLVWESEPASGPLGGIVSIADLDLDGRLELTDGTRALRHDGTVLWKLRETGGLAAIADIVTADGRMGPDGLPEVVVARAGQLEVRHGLTGEHVLPTMLLPTWDGSACYPEAGAPGVGGPPAVGDLNGDAVPEVVVASGQCLAAMALVNPFQPRWQTYWAWPAVDGTSSVTGAALFDFHGDRKPSAPGGRFLDVVHADETLLHVLRGDNGAYRFLGDHCSGTIYENPVVADVDGDGSADVVLGVNTTGGSAVGCKADIEPGVVVLRERKSRWANARSIWNQHAYTPWSVCDGSDEVCTANGEWTQHGRIPFEPTPLFEQTVARANSHGSLRPRGAANAVLSDWKIVRDRCPEELSLLVRVINEGEAPLRAGTVVQVLREGVLLSETRLDRPLPHGSARVLSLPLPTSDTAGEDLGNVFIVLDPDDRTAECAEEDNVEGPIWVSCE